MEVLRRVEVDEEDEEDASSYVKRIFRMLLRKKQITPVRLPSCTTKPLSALPCSTVMFQYHIGVRCRNYEVRYNWSWECI